MENMNVILVALDFTENPEQLLQKTSIFASRYKSQIHVIHVIPDITPTPLYGEVGHFIADYMGVATDAAERELQNYIEPLASEFDTVVPVIKVGDPATQIVETAEKLDAGLIILGDHCRTGFSHFIHRNVAEQVLRTAKRSILTFYVPC